MATKRKTHTLDATTGPIVRQLLALFLPVLAGALFQGLFTLSNVYFVGQYASATSLSAIQTTAKLTELVIGITMGVSLGCSVVVSQQFGSRDKEKLSLAMHTALALSLVLGFICSIVGVIGAKPLLLLMGTADKLLPESLAFVSIYLGTACLPVVFNMGQALQRAVGNTGMPTLVAALAWLVNVGLDLLLVQRLDMGAQGAALATAGAYLAGCLLTLALLMLARGPWRLRPNKIRINPTMANDMLTCTIPLAIQTTILPLTNAVVQPSVSSFGPEMVVSWGLAARIGTIAWLAADIFAMAITTFSAQNFGAARYDRMRRGLHVSLILSVLGMVMVEALICLQSSGLVRLLESNSTIISLTASLVVLTVPFCFIYALMDNVAGIIRGSGETLRPTLIIFAGTCMLRVAWMYGVLPRHHTIVTAILSYPVAWIVTTILFVIYYRHGRWLSRALRQTRRRRIGRHRYTPGRHARRPRHATKARHQS